MKLKLFITILITVLMGREALCQIKNGDFSHWQNGPTGYTPVSWSSTNSLAYGSVAELNKGGETVVVLTPKPNFNATGIIAGGISQSGTLTHQAKSLLIRYSYWRGDSTSHRNGGGFVELYNRNSGIKLSRTFFDLKESMSLKDTIINLPSASTKGDSFSIVLSSSPLSPRDDSLIIDSVVFNTQPSTSRPTVKPADRMTIFTVNQELCFKTKQPGVVSVYSIAGQQMFEKQVVPNQKHCSGVILQPTKPIVIVNNSLGRVYIQKFSLVPEYFFSLE